MTRNSLSLVGLLGVALSLLSCATGRSAPQLLPQEPPSEAQVQESTPLQPNLDALYWRLAVYGAAYEDGVELVLAGEEVLGEEKIATAAEALLADVEECSQMAGCDIRPYLDVFERLLSSQGLALKLQAARVEELETSAQADVQREPGTSPFTAPMPELGRSASLLKGNDLRQIITLNGPVNAAIDDWLTWMRPMLMASHHNYRFLRAKIAPIYEEAGLPEALLFAMLATETGGKVHSYSRAGAAGPLQFMRRTGQRYGLKVIDGFDTRLDPVAATRANVAFLNDQLEVLNDSLELALAAYNGGETRMKNLYRKYGGSLWDPRVYYSLPRETREYVPRILAAAWLFLHPEDYNLEFPSLDAETALLELEQDIALDELTICLGQKRNPEGWFRTLRNLNPRLSPGDRIEAGREIEIPAFLVAVYEERCLEGEHLQRAQQLHDANYPLEPPMIRYTVRRGDSLGKIASRHRCASIRELAAINDIRPPRYVVGIGRTLKIPTCP